MRKLVHDQRCRHLIIYSGSEGLYCSTSIAYVSNEVSTGRTLCGAFFASELV